MIGREREEKKGVTEGEAMGLWVMQSILKSPEGEGMVKNGWGWILIGSIGKKKKHCETMCEKLDLEAQH